MSTKACRSNGGVDVPKQEVLRASRFWNTNAIGDQRESDMMHTPHSLDKVPDTNTRGSRTES